MFKTYITLTVSHFQNCATCWYLCVISTIIHLSHFPSLSLFSFLCFTPCLFSISDLRSHLVRDNLLNVCSDLVFRFHKKGTQENDEPSRVASQTWNLLHKDLLRAKWGNVTELKSRQVLDVRHSLSLCSSYYLVESRRMDVCLDTLWNLKFITPLYFCFVLFHLPSENFCCLFTLQSHVHFYHALL